MTIHGQGKESITYVNIFGQGIDTNENMKIQGQE